MESKEYSKALNLLSGLIKEVRRLDDKLLLVDIDFLESKLHFYLRNLPKAKASLTAARNSAKFPRYGPPAQQGTIDCRVGSSMRKIRTTKLLVAISLKRLKLSMLLKNHGQFLALVYAVMQDNGLDLDAMKAAADAHSKGSLKLFETALKDFRAQLEGDPMDAQAPLFSVRHVVGAESLQAD
ncbi:hypothetical protein CJ030_MR2G024666 [Morella rubra]|uniref:Uncharacterized protein n=1 Tax=Morella rubra TaxID=262757 RepID=A0A6A1WI36_9ROSI|nr:hypothetical protein CJ030_MR2G024666 [Morella rubra]